MIAAFKNSLQSLNDRKKYAIIDINEYINVDSFRPQYLIEQVKSRGDFLFQQPEINDKKRRQIVGDLNNDDIQKWYLSMCNAAKSVDDKLKPSEVSVIVSEEGCIEQRAHYDFNMKYLEATKQSYLVILAIMDNTTLVVYDESGKGIEVEIPKGHMLVARGDLIHAGSSYGIDHVRLHMYRDGKRNGRKVGKTYFYDFKSNVSIAADKYRKFREAVKRNAAIARECILNKKAKNFLIGQSLIDLRAKKRNALLSEVDK